MKNENAMTKTRLTKAAAKATGLSQTLAATCVDAIIETLGEAISEGGKVELRGFGTFQVQRVREKKTGVAGTVPPHGRITFRPCQKLREAAWDIGWERQTGREAAK